MRRTPQNLVLGVLDKRAAMPVTMALHMDLRFFAIQDWREGDGTEGSGDLMMAHMPGRLNPSDDLTKSLGWVLHGKHCRRVMGHCNYPD